MNTPGTNEPGFPETGYCVSGRLTPNLPTSVPYWAINAGIDIRGWNWIRFWAMLLCSDLGIGPSQRPVVARKVLLRTILANQPPIPGRARPRCSRRNRELGCPPAGRGWPRLQASEFSASARFMSLERARAD